MYKEEALTSHQSGYLDWFAIIDFFDIEVGFLYPLLSLLQYFFRRIYIIKELAINEQIVAKEVRLLGEQGEQLGIFSITDALAQAEDAGLDLVAINPNADPIVCRIMNYGKYKFIAQKRDKEAKKKQKVADIKGMELSMRIEEHDMRYKANQVVKFLQNGDKVRVIIKGVRGRMANFAHFGIDNMNKFYEMLQEFCVMDQKPLLSGSVITMILAPKDKK